MEGMEEVTGTRDKYLLFRVGSTDGGTRFEY